MTEVFKCEGFECGARFETVPPCVKVSEYVRQCGDAYSSTHTLQRGFMCPVCTATRLNKGFVPLMAWSSKSEVRSNRIFDKIEK